MEQSLQSGQEIQISVGVPRSVSRTKCSSSCRLVNFSLQGVVGKPKGALKAACKPEGCMQSAEPVSDILKSQYRGRWPKGPVAVRKMRRQVMPSPSPSASSTMCCS